MKCISVSATLFRTQSPEPRAQTFYSRCLFFVLCSVLCVLCSTFSYAEVLDRVVAIVDDEVVMLSEFNEAFQNALNSGIEVTQEEVLDGLINRILLLKQAKKFKREHVFAAQTRKDNNVLINEYIEKRLKAFIRIPFDEIELFYEENKEFFNNDDFYDVRDEIEAYLTEKELNKRLIRHIEELRGKAYIRIQLKTEHR